MWQATQAQLVEAGQELLFMLAPEQLEHPVAHDLRPFTRRDHQLQAQQPLVVQPVTTSVSTPSGWSYDTGLWYGPVATPWTLDNYFVDNGQLVQRTGAATVTNCYFNNPVDYLPNLNDPWFLDQIRRMGIVLGTGDRDGCRDRNLHLSHLLNAKGIPHFLDDRKWCGHDWNYWRDMFPHYVSLIKG